MTQPISEKKVYELFNGGVPPRTTREKLLYTAMDLFHVDGFHAVGVDRIIAEVGVTKTTFYNHFPSKDDLILEVIRTRDEWESRAFWAQVEQKGGGDPRRMLLAVFDALEEWFNSPDFNGCAFLNACIEFPSANDPIHHAGAKHMLSFEDGLIDLARRAGADDPEALAASFTLLIQGAMVVRHAMSRDDAAATARVLAERLLDRTLPASAS